MLALRFKIDPAVVSAPLITTLVDATGLAIYLTIARLLLPELR
jgi:magnesium transporter